MVEYEDDLDDTQILIDLDESYVESSSNDFSKVWVLYIVEYFNLG